MEAGPPVRYYGKSVWGDGQAKESWFEVVNKSLRTIGKGASSLADKKVVFQCAGCGAVREMEAQSGQATKAPICCGQPMKEVARKAA